MMPKKHTHKATP
jgi:hypothetical protein